MICIPEIWVGVCLGSLVTTAARVGVAVILTRAAKRKPVRRG